MSASLLDSSSLSFSHEWELQNLRTILQDDCNFTDMTTISDDHISSYSEPPIVAIHPPFYRSCKEPTQFNVEMSNPNNDGFASDFSNDYLSMNFRDCSGSTSPQRVQYENVDSPSGSFTQIPLLCTPFSSPAFESQQPFDPSFPESPPYVERRNDRDHVVKAESLSTQPTSPHLRSSPLKLGMLRQPKPHRDLKYCMMQAEKNQEESSYDEPYAQLIYKALMQAPGHRMMLRDIYEWFQRNTTKPQESGTNGWQNSIRHNLSMNQAFENDKTDASNRTGQVKKSNSVWVLTDFAIKNGVQSTTRYRKSGNAKKTSLTRVPALQRQRSGARGGQAARRAAKLKQRRRQQSALRKELTVSVSPPISACGFGDSYTANADYDYFSIYTPKTPPDDRLFSMSTGTANVSATSHGSELSVPMRGDQYAHESGSYMHELGFLPANDPGLDEIIYFHADTKSAMIAV